MNPTTRTMLLNFGIVVAAVIVGSIGYDKVVKPRLDK